jgi:uncharacterized protein YbaP (TraB family)
MLKFHHKYLRYSAAVLFSVGVSIGLHVYSAAGQVPSEKTLLWEISGKGLAKPSYLYGTIHLACPEQLVVPKSVQERFAKTQQLFLELDMDDPTMLPATVQGAVMDKGTTLKTLLNPQDYATAQQYFQQNLGVSIDQVGTIKPFVLVALLYPSFLGCQQPGSWEGMLTKLAQTRQMEILGLESVQEQLAIFDRIPLREQVAMLMEVINDPHKAKQQVQELLAAYRNQDMPVIHQMVIQSTQTETKYETILLTERNRRWIPKIAKAAQTKSTFFAVGAGHLGGRNGVVAILRQAGYVVKPIFGDRKP